MKTPWGQSQIIDKVTEGITFVTTAGHGGYKLSKSRLKQIPRLVLATTFGSLGLQGWFEEDQDCVIVYCYFPDAFPWKDTADWDRIHRELKRINIEAYADLKEKRRV